MAIAKIATHDNRDRTGGLFEAGEDSRDEPVCPDASFGMVAPVRHSTQNIRSVGSLNTGRRIHRHTCFLRDTLPLQDRIAHLLENLLGPTAPDRNCPGAGLEILHVESVAFAVQ